MGKNVIEVKNVTKKFNDNTIISNLSFNVIENTIFGFIGPNGAGKTTTMKMILGLLKIDEGQILVCGERVSKGYTKTNKYIGYLPDVPEFYEYMTPKEYLSFCSELINMDKTIANSRIDELLTLVGLSEYDKRIKGFSRGMKQRLGIAQALINKPKILICDEPTSALDPIGRKEILDILVKIKNETTIIFSTHILSDVASICDDVLVINKGEKVIMGSLHDIKNKYNTNKLLIEFENDIDKQKFIMLANLNIIADNTNNVILEGDLKSLKKEVIRVLYENEVYPKKLEELEVDIENILLEAVK